MTERVCGECTVCCFVTKVPELDKPVAAAASRHAAYLLRFDRKQEVSP